MPQIVVRNKTKIAKAESNKLANGDYAFSELFDHVEIVEKEDMIGCGPGNMDRKKATTYTVKVFWKAPYGENKGSWSCSNNRKLAERLKRCIEDGVAIPTVELDIDVTGNQYAYGALENILMRCANADLRRLGY